MKIVTIYHDAKTKVVAVHYAGKFMYTVTYTFDDEGFVEKCVTVFANGTVDIQ